MNFRTIWGMLLLLVCITTNAQNFTQQFRTAIGSTTSVTDPAYVSTTNPSDTQFTYLGSTGAGLTVSVPASGSNAQSLLIDRTADVAGLSGGFVRNQNPPTASTALYIQFDVTFLTTGGATANAVKFMAGNLFTNTPAEETSTARFAAKFGFSLTPNAGEFNMTNAAGTAVGPTYTGRQRITLVLNRGGTIIYHTRSGVGKSLATRRYDVYVGDDRVITNAAANNVLIDQFKLSFLSGVGSIAIDNVLIDNLPAAPVGATPTAVTHQSFTARWNPVAGVEGYRVDVSAASNFSTFIHKNLFVAADSLPVSGLSAGTNYYYRVRAVNVYEVDSITGGNSSTQTVTTAPSIPVLSPATTVSAILHDRATLGGTILSASGSPITQRGFVIAKKTENSNPLVGGTNVSTVVASGTTTGAYSQLVTGLSPATIYVIKAFATNAYGTGYAAIREFSTTAAEPAAYPAISFDNISTTGYRLNWNWTSVQAPPAGYIVLMRMVPGALNSSHPADGKTYNVGDTIGDAKVMYIGTGDNLTFTGLNPGTGYGVTVYPFNGADSTTNYRTTTSGMSRQLRYTLAPAPTQHATSVTVTNYNQGFVTLAFPPASSLPNGKGYLVLRKAGTVPATSKPANAVWYAAGAVIGDAVVGAVVPNPAATSVTVSGLAANTTYTFSLIPFDTVTNVQTVHYNTAAGEATVTATTLIAEPSRSPVLSFTLVGPDSMRVNFTAATGATGYILFQTLNPGPALHDSFPLDRQVYNVGDTVGNARVIYIATSTAAPRFLDVKGLSPNTQYSFAVYPYAENSTGINYRVAAPARATKFTTIGSAPTQHTASFTVDSIGSFAVKLGFDSAGSIPNAKGYLILRRQASASTSLPVNGTAYTVGSTVGTAVVAAIVKSTSDTAVVVGSLLDNVTYYFTIFPFNADTANIGTAEYYTASPVPQVMAVTTPPVAPGGNPTNLVFDQVTKNSMRLTWKASTVFPNMGVGYLVLRTTNSGGALPNTAPVDGTTYTVGSTLGNATVVYVGTALLTTATGLQSDSEYGYSIYAYRHSGTATLYHLTNPPLQGTKSTVLEPPTVQTAFGAFDHTTNSITITWLNTSPAPDGFMLVRTTAANSTAVPTVPANGNVYATGGTYGNATVLYIGDDTAYLNAGLAAGARYNYAVYPFNGSMADTTANFLTAAAPQASYYTLALKPAMHSSVFEIESRTASSLTPEFIPATNIPQNAGYLLLYTPGNTTISDTPVNGQGYAVGDMVGSATVGAVVIGNAINATITGLLPDTEYTLQLIPFNRGGSAALTYHYNNDGNAPTLVARTLATAPAAPTDLSFTNAVQSLTLSWTGAATAPSGYLVLRTTSPGFEYPNQQPGSDAVYTTGQAVGNATVVYKGSGTTFTDAGLVAGSRYNYHVYSFNTGSGDNTGYSAPLAGFYYTLALKPLSHSNTLSVSNITPSEMQLNYAAASTLGNAAGYIVLVKQGTTPPSELPANATGYAVGSAIGGATVAAVVGSTSTSVVVSGLTPLTDYSFSLIPFNTSGDEHALANHYKTDGAIPTATAQTESPLPVDFVRYSAVAQKKEVVVRWTVANEINIQHYEVERSADGMVFTSIAKVPATAAWGELNYIASDLQPLPATAYYRVKAIGAAGYTRYTGIMVVKQMAGTAEVKVYPNPATASHFYVSLNYVKAGKYSLALYDALGKTVLTKEIVATTGSVETMQLTLPASLPAGSYYLVVTGNDFRFTQSILSK